MTREMLWKTRVEILGLFSCIIPAWPLRRIPLLRGKYELEAGDVHTKLFCSRGIEYLKDHLSALERSVSSHCALHKLLYSVEVCATHIDFQCLAI